MGYPTDYFAVLFTLGRLPGWIAQWEEMLNDKETKIARPRQFYVGEEERPFVPMETASETDSRPTQRGARRPAGPS